MKGIKVKPLSGEKRVNSLSESLTDTQAEVAQWAAKTLADEIKNDGPNKIRAIDALKSFSKDRSNRRYYLGIKWLNFLVEEGKIKEEDLYK